MTRDMSHNVPFVIVTIPSSSSSVIYYTDAAGMLLHINGKFTMGKCYALIWLRVSFFGPHCQLPGVDQGIKQT
jgi:hypothetical protein